MSVYMQHDWMPTSRILVDECKRCGAIRHEHCTGPGEGYTKYRLRDDDREFDHVVCVPRDRITL